MGKKFITSALPYVNNQPHLGNIVGSVLGGDVYARYCRKQGDDVVYICGTDEYGTATEMEAMKQGVHPREIVEKNRSHHKRIYDWLNLRFDNFGKTDCEDHIKMTQTIFRKCYENGYFEEQEVPQYYCKACDQFLADRYVEGTCNLCGYGCARGDQCDKCGCCLKGTDLIDPKCVLCSGTPCLRSSNHLFLRLDKLQDRIRAYFKTTKDGWTANAQVIYEEWMKKKIHVRCMTRLLKYRWGVPVPLAGFEDKVFYVWFDAPIGYLTFLAQVKPDWQEWAVDARFVQFMGKDNVPFHSIIFPGMLLAASNPNYVNSLLLSQSEQDGAAACEGSKTVVDNIQNLVIDKTGAGVERLGRDGAAGCRRAYPIVDVINSTEYLQFNGEKFSKSRGVGIFGLDLVTKDIGCCDFWRFYLIEKRPETKDSNFSLEGFISHVEGSLISNLGNLYNRTLLFISKRLGGKVDVERIDPADEVFVSEVNALFGDYKSLMDRISLRDALGKVFEIATKGNRYLQSLQNDKERLRHGFSVCYSLLVFLGHLVEPFLPETAVKMFSLCGVSPAGGPFPERFEISRKAEISGDISVLFSPFTPEQLQALREYNIKS